MIPQTLSLFLEHFSFAVLELEEHGESDSAERILTNLDNQLATLPEEAIGKIEATTRIIVCWADHWAIQNDWKKVVQYGSRIMNIEDVDPTQRTLVVFHISEALQQMDCKSEAILAMVTNLIYLTNNGGHDHDKGSCLYKLSKLLSSNFELRKIVPKLREWVMLANQDTVSFSEAVKIGDLSNWARKLASSFYPELDGATS